nr:MAG TPA: Putative flagellar [Caudoviricetes sp.]
MFTNIDSIRIRKALLNVYLLLTSRKLICTSIR